MAVLLSFSIRLTSGNGGRSAIRAMSSASSYHLRPHCTNRAASAITMSRAASSEGAILAGCLGTVRGAGFEAAARRGKAEGSTCSFTLTIIGEDLERMLSEPGHQAALTLTGTNSFSTGVVQLSYAPAPKSG